MRGKRFMRPTPRLGALAVVAAALIVGSCVASPSAGSVGSPPATAAAPASPSSAADWSPPPLPKSVEGHHVLTVSDAIQQRDAGTLGGRTVAVGGYWSVRSFPLSCPMPMASPGELEMYCNADQSGITERYEAIAAVTRDVNSMSFSETQHPHLNPYVPAELHDELFNGSQTLDDDTPPVPIVVLGHFNDSRAKDCQPDATQACRERFVIESVLLFDPVHAPPATPTPAPTPFPSPAPSALFDAKACSGDVPYSFVGWTTTDEVHSTIQHNGHFFAAVTRDPVPVGQWFDDPNTADHHLSIGYGRRVCASTPEEPGGMEFGVILGTAFHLWDDGHITPGDDIFGPGGGIASAPPQAPPAADPSPFVTKIRGTNIADATLTVLDWSGMLSAARPATADELRAGDVVQPPVGVIVAPGDPRALILIWAECASDSAATAVITQDRATILLQDQPRMDCVGEGARRAAVLTFDSPVPAGITSALVGP